MLVNITIPVLNEEACLADSVQKVVNFALRHCRFDYEITIADNGSTDNTRKIAEKLGREYPRVYPLHLERRGRGRAVKRAWEMSGADVLTFMDVDLSADLFAFPPLVEALLGGGFDLASGSRLLKPKSTVRGMKREVISRVYNRLVRISMRTGFSDAQCGFKAITRAAARELLPMVENDCWFFDTELMVLGEKLGYRVFDLPIHWVDDLGSRVSILKMVMECLGGLLRMHRTIANSEHMKRRAAGLGSDLGLGAAPLFGSRGALSSSELRRGARRDFET